MAELSIELSRMEYRPREVVHGAASWRFDAAPATLEVRLVWFTRGKGTVDATVVEKVRFVSPLAHDRKMFELRLPDAPYSFSGRLVSLIWAVELVAEPGKEHTLAELIMAPEGREIVLPKIETAEDAKRAKWEQRFAGLTTRESAR